MIFIIASSRRKKVFALEILMGCKGSRPIGSLHDSQERINTGGAVTHQSSSEGGNPITNKISSEEKSIRTARILRNVTIYERYDILFENVLGSGISGEVREAVSKTTGEHVAVKTLSTTNLTPKKFDMMFNEVEIYLKVDHPNICKLLEVFEDDTAIHLVMELCSGKELYERLAQLRRYTERDAAIVANQMLEAISYCHAHNICHRDIKLENWVYANASPDAPLKLIDWGMSKIYTGVPMTQVHGTVYYVAPEVLAGKYDQKCDVWSIGVIVYMLLSGSPPFGGQHDHEIIQRIKTANITFEGPRWAGISQKAKDFVVFLLNRDPTERPSASDCMHHPWLAETLGNGEDTTTSTSIDIGVLKNIQTFSRQNAIRRAALGLIALSMTQGEVDVVEEEFRKLDKQKVGTISLEGLTKVLQTQLNMSEAEAKLIFNRMDQTGNQEIHYTEFLAAALQAKMILNEKYIKQAFQKFDVDNTGLISEEDLRRVLGDEYKGEDVGQIMRQVDYKNNGYIDYDEFVKALMDTTCVEPATAGTNEHYNEQSVRSRRMFANKLLQMSDESVRLANEHNGPSTFTWGSCRRDGRFKFDMNMNILEGLPEKPIRETVSEHDGESDPERSDP
jgi:calcium-dependent protein kinase